MPGLEEIRNEQEQIAVKAFDVASAYDLRKAKEVLQKGFPGKMLTPDPLMVQFDAHTLVVVFSYGSIVFFNMALPLVQQVMDSLEQCASRRNKFVSEDDFLLYLASRQQRPEGTDEWYVRELSRDIALLVAIVLSRSVSLEYYEKLVGEALAQFEQTISALATKGWIPHRQREAAKHVGFALAVEHELAHDIAVFDDPEIVWDGGKRVDQLYVSLKREFDLEARMKILQQKISIISRFSTFVLSRLEAQRASYLEWIIIILIVGEILLSLIGRS